jgi:hypothetical protein
VQIQALRPLKLVINPSSAGYSEDGSDGVEVPAMTWRTQMSRSATSLPLYSKSNLYSLSWPLEPKLPAAHSVFCQIF